MKKYKSSKAVMITAASSGSGKTMITCALLWALKRNRQLKPVSFKCGPDYIDPMFHKSVIDIPSLNLDAFFMKKEELREVFARYSNNQDVAVIEGVMGYYDGIAGNTDIASSYEVADILNVPAILIVDTKGMSLTAAAIIKGIKEYKENSHIKGVILNRTSKVIYDRLHIIIEAELGVKVLGYMPNIEAFNFDSRHLGLIQPKEVFDIEKKLEKISEVFEECVDISAIIELAKEAGKHTVDLENIYQFSDNLVDNSAEKNQLIKVAYAFDKAFSFYYEENLRLFREMNIELIPFSPLEDKTLPIGIAGLLIGGGYPEIYAKELSLNSTMLNSIKKRLDFGLPCIAECGGFMYLHSELESTSSKFYKMVGVISGKSYNKKQLGRFGYITLKAEKNNMLCSAGEEIKAHEFHYWDSESNGNTCTAYKPMSERKWECIVSSENLFAGYPHLYLSSNKNFVTNFVKKCKMFSDEMKREVINK
jgi:cobyrinic acid a,c-diamide synthase